MKPLIILFAFIGSARYCSKTDRYAMLDKNNHPDILHKLEMSLASDLNSDDSMTAADASRFMNEFEKEFSSYHPDRKTCDRLAGAMKGAEVKVIGGNWCSDTRREVPRLCKVLYYAGLPADKFSYYRVNREKKAIDEDFASQQQVSRVPVIYVYKEGNLRGTIVETPRKSLEADLLNLLR